MKNLKNTIIQKASLLFAQKGTQATSMDDVAEECEISKKTAYLFFTSKEELVLKVVETQLAKTQQYLYIYSGISPDAITELNNFFGCIEKMLDIFTPAFLADIKKYFPSAYKQIEAFEQKHLISFIHQNISRGITEQTYRSDLRKDLAGRMYSWELHKAMEEKGTGRQPATQEVFNMNNFFLHSLVNSKGKTLLLARNQMSTW